MALTKVKVGGWAVSEEITSADLTAVDENIENALDKRTGQTDTLESIVTETNGGRIVKEYTTGADADGNYVVGDGGIIVIPTLTANRTYTLLTTGAVAGDTISFFISAATYTVTIAYSGTLYVLGTNAHATADGSWCKVLYNGSAWVLFESGESRAISTVYTASGTWVCPRGVRRIDIIGMGGGGGGGGGAGALGSAANNLVIGAGGGGAAPTTRMSVAVTPGTTYDVNIGAGGAGGGAVAGVLSGSFSNAGQNGGETEFTDNASLYCYFQGGSGGAGGFNSGGLTVYRTYGGTNAGPSFGTYGENIITSSYRGTIQHLGQGGYGNIIGYTDQSAGARNSRNSGTSADNLGTGGVGGSPGATAGTHYGGGGGGGGAGSEYGTGGDGNDGGDGNSGGAGLNGFSGLNATGYGAGGGGGGSAGTGTGGSGTAGGGGNGSGGRLEIIYWR